VDVLVAALARTAQAAEAPQPQQTTMPEGMQVHIEADPRMKKYLTWLELDTAEIEKRRQAAALAPKPAADATGRADRSQAA